MNATTALRETATYDELQRTHAPHLCTGDPPAICNEKVVAWSEEDKLQLAETIRYRYSKSTLRDKRPFCASSGYNGHETYTNSKVLIKGAFYANAVAREAEITLAGQRFSPNLGGQHSSLQMDKMKSHYKFRNSLAFKNEELQEIDKGSDQEKTSIFERGSPKSMKILRSLLLAFLDDADGLFTLRKKISLSDYSQTSGQEITNAVVQEVCILKPDMVALDLSGCNHVDDVGLWAIARHSCNLRELVLKGCSKISHVGIRSLILECRLLRSLDLSDCTQIDDQAIKALAAGAGGLHFLTLENCPGFGDSSMVELAGALSNITSLNLKGCSGIRNFRDRVLIRLADTAVNVESLRFEGVASIGDLGVKALASQCTSLKRLSLAPCTCLTASGFRALGKGLGTTLTKLSLSGSRFALPEMFACMNQLVELEFSKSSELRSAAVEAIVTGSPKLLRLDFHSCNNLDAACFQSLTRCLWRLQSLNLSNCNGLSAWAIESLVIKWPKLERLDLTGINGISRAFLLELSKRLIYAKVADSFVGYEPKADIQNLRTNADIFARSTIHVIKIQRLIRGTLARARIKILKKEAVICTSLHKAQALIRGHIARVKYVDLKQDLRRELAAKIIQRVYRGSKTREQYRDVFIQRRLYEKKVLLARLTQKLWRGHRGRAKMQALRNKLAREALQAAQVRAAQEVYASKIQRPWRGYHARGFAKSLRQKKDNAEARRLKRERGAIEMQRVVRGWRGRKEAAARVRIKERLILEWSSARIIQSVWRGKLARILCTTMKDKAHEVIQNRCASLIQRAWRGGRARHFATIQKKLAKLRAKERQSTIKIQKHWRGRQARVQVRKMIQNSNVIRLTNSSATKVQQVYRGYKGREAFEVALAMREAETIAKPLVDKQNLIKGQLAESQVAAVECKKKLKDLQEDLVKFDVEIKLANESSVLFTDSSRIHGTPQRYITKYLRLKLVQERQKQETVLKRMRSKATEVDDSIHDMERQLSLIDRELLPFLRGAEERVKVARRRRLWDRVKVEYRCTSSIQSLYRGWRVRKALSSWRRDFWVQVLDEATDTFYYLNTCTQEIVWRKPYEMVISELIKAKDSNPISLPAGWTKQRDPRLKLVYFYNQNRNEYRWEAPADKTLLGKGAKIFDSSWFERQDKVAFARTSYKTRTIGLWEERREPSTGVTFYWQPQLEEARYSLSPRSALQEDSKFPIAPGPNGWSRVVDKEDGSTFFYNSETTSAQWESPAAEIML